jgi:hypothetical protein
LKQDGRDRQTRDEQLGKKGQRQRQMEAVHQGLKRIGEVIVKTSSCVKASGCGKNETKVKVTTLIYV